MFSPPAPQCTNTDLLFSKVPRHRVWECIQQRPLQSEGTDPRRGGDFVGLALAAVGEGGEGSFFSKAVSEAADEVEREAKVSWV